MILGNVQFSVEGDGPQRVLVVHLSDQQIPGVRVQLSRGDFFRLANWANGEGERTPEPPPPLPSPPPSTRRR